MELDAPGMIRLQSDEGIYLLFTFSAYVCVLRDLMELCSSIMALQRIAGVIDRL